jgi:hypothetical protein
VFEEPVFEEPVFEEPVFEEPVFGGSVFEGSGPMGPRVTPIVRLSNHFAGSSGAERAGER